MRLVGFLRERVNEYKDVVEIVTRINEVDSTDDFGYSEYEFDVTRQKIPCKILPPMGKSTNKQRNSDSEYTEFDLEIEIPWVPTLSNKDQIFFQKENYKIEKIDRDSRKSFIRLRLLAMNSQADNNE